MPDYIPPPPDLPPGSIVWAYLRDSGGPTQDRSVQQQREVLVEYCQKYGLHLALVFADVHKSGTTDDDREQFNELVDMTTHERARPDGLLIWSFARFARNELDSQYFKSTLRRRGIIIHSIIDDLPAGKYQIAFEAILDIANREKAEQASREARRGLQSIVKSGAMPGIPPRGFKREPFTTISEDGIKHTLHRWIPDLDWIPRIRLAFQMRAAGHSLQEINAATHLFSSLNSYTTFFRNLIYIGILRFGELTIPNYCEPIIDCVTWDAVQQISDRFAEHHHLHTVHDHPRRKNSTYLLSGLVYCARCNSPMWGETSPKKTYNLEAYRCTRASRRHDCDARRIPAHVLQTTVIETVINALSDPQFFAHILRETYSLHSTRQAKLDEQRRDLENRLRGIKRQADNIANAIAETGHSQTLLDRLARVENDQRELQLQLTALERPSTPLPPPPTEEQLAARAVRLAQIIQSKDPATLRPILHAIITRIDVDRQDKEIFGTITIGLDDPYASNDPSATKSPLPPKNDQSGHNHSTSSAGMRKSRAPVGALENHLFEVVFSLKP